MDCSAAGKLRGRRLEMPSKKPGSNSSTKTAAAQESGYGNANGRSGLSNCNFILKAAGDKTNPIWGPDPFSAPFCILGVRLFLICSVALIVLIVFIIRHVVGSEVLMRKNSTRQVQNRTN